MGVDNTGNGLNFFADKVPDIHTIIDIEFRNDVIGSGDRVNFGRNFRISQSIGDVISLAKLAFDFNKEGLPGFAIL